MAGFNRDYGYLFLFTKNPVDSIKFMRKIEESTYKASLKVQDLDAFRDANGVLHRNVLSNVPLTASFTTLDGLTDTEMEDTWGALIRHSYIVRNERKINATFWMPELNDYVTQDVYLPDPEFTIKEVRKNKSGKYEVVYKPVTFEFIGY